MSGIILDCDPGHDDAIALLLALASPELELQGVTTVAGNHTLAKTTANAIRVLDHLGRTDIPVAPGASGPLLRELTIADHVHGSSGLDGPRLPQPSRPPADEQAAEAFARVLRRRYGWEGAPVHDAVAVAAVIDPSLLETRWCGVVTDTGGDLSRGRSYVDLWGAAGWQPNRRVAVGIDASRFLDLLVDRISTLP